MRRRDITRSQTEYRFDPDRQRVTLEGVPIQQGVVGLVGVGEQARQIRARRKKEVYLMIGTTSTRIFLFTIVIVLVLVGCEGTEPEPASLTEPIFPVTIEEWNNEMARRGTELTREGDHYWRYVPDGTYTIGGWTDDDREDNDEQAEVELQPYWIGKYPITVQQYRQFIEAGGYDNQEYWTPNGWKWRQEKNRTQPWGWNDEKHSSDNQPVIGVTWYEATAFMNWLNVQLAGALPEGYAVQLPTEAEGEAACAYDAEGHRHPYPWGEEEPTHDLADFGKDWQTDSPAEVGGRLGGAAACGAQDMVGSVWEVTTSSYGGYPGASGEVVGDFEANDDVVPWRMASWLDSRTYVQCAARYRSHPTYIWHFNLGFRPVVSPLRAS